MNLEEIAEVLEVSLKLMAAPLGTLCKILRVKLYEQDKARLMEL